MRLRVGHQHSQFWPILARFLDYYSLFLVPIVISIVVEPKVPLRGGHQHSQFWPILARFMDYYSLFWGPKAISMVNEPWGAFTIWSSTLAGLVDSDAFHGLLLTVLGTQTGFVVVEPQGAFTCRSSTLTVLTDSGPFLGLLLTVSVSHSDFHSC